jgi:gamma-glutamyl hercynylcysteine S-oxide synthase
VRGRVLTALENAALDGEDPLRRGGFAYGMVVQHERQHQETMLQTLALMDFPYPLPPLEQPAAPAPRRAVELPGGAALIGTDAEPWAYDNEHAAHRVELAPYRLDTAPVTNADWMAFIAAGGYDEESLWQPQGWCWRRSEDAQAPGGWRREGAGWSRRRFGCYEEPPPDEPVQHVSFWEADAFARFAGARLPSEAEWEAAATDALRRKRRYPCCDDDPRPEHANLGARRFAPAPAGSYPEGASVDGCLALIGDVWEWTASGFEAYPGFRAFPYREYSEVFFGGDYRVLRGGSWASHGSAVRGTFRNWDHPVRRQIFAGVRLAHDG